MTRPPHGPLPPAGSGAPIGRRFGAYEVTGPLGRGGMGEVYRARHVETGRDAAVKVILSAGIGSLADEEVARFKREAAVLHRIDSHPGIVRLQSFGVAGGTLYTVMDLVDGEPLSDVIARGPLPAERAAHEVRRQRAGDLADSEDGARVLEHDEELHRSL